ncbi:MAG TPA: VWA domain-containing protein [Gemmatimonadaceae bacterium]|nr:VWA domain-containing protein [Gemmatimonadaceae bacterium]
MTILGYFDRPWMLGLALLLSFVAALAVAITFRRRRARLQRLGSGDVVSRLVPPSSPAIARWRALLLAMAALLAGIGAAGPRWGVEQTIIRGEGIDMVLALDASLSMMANDERPNRLERLKQEVRRLRAMSSGDRVGVLAFAGRSYILTPLTIDDGALDLYLDNLDPSVVGQAGSALSRAIRQGAALLSATESGADRALVVMSDGEFFESEDEIVAAARLAAERGIHVVTVGFGTTEGSRIPVRNAEGTGFHRDQQGQVVVTRYSPDLLRAAAEAAGGTFIDAAETDKAGRIRRALSTLRTQRRAAAAGEERTPRFQLFLFPALALLLLDTMLADRRGRRRRAPGAATPTAPAAAAALLLVVGLGACDRPGDAAARAFRAGDYARAAALFRRAINEGDRRPEAMYNYGTALTAAESLEAAVEVLARMQQVQDPELRFRALFNLGLAHLLEGRATSGEAGAPPLDSAIAVYQRSLRLRSDDMDAKWNYELALRDPRSSGGGGGGGGDSEQQPDPQPSPEGPPQETETPSGGLGQRQAEQILEAAAREERSVQARSQRQTRPTTPPGGRDW